MSMWKTVGACIAAMFQTFTNFFTMVLPSVGETVYRTTEMVNSTVGDAYEEMLIENRENINKLYESANIGTSEKAEIQAKVNAYRTNGIKLQQATSRHEAHSSNQSNTTHTTQESPS